MTTSPILPRLDARRRRSLWRRFAARPIGMVSLGILALIVVVALLAPLLPLADPNFVDLAATKAPPSPEHPLGGDSSGRDVLSRLIWGAQTTLYGALVAVIAGLVVGVPAGVAAGYVGGRTDRVAVWISDALQSIPAMVVLLIVAAATRADFLIVMITVGVFMAPGYFRITRSTALSVRNEAYIDASKVAGLSDLRIVVRHVAPATYPALLIQTALTAGVAMGFQAGLQFIGIGSGAVPSWGAMMNDGFKNMLTVPLLLLWPAVALGLTIAVVALIGSTLADLVSVRTPAARPRRRRGASAPSRPLARATGSTVHAPADSAIHLSGLRVEYRGSAGTTEVVHGISLDVGRGEVLGVVGESGSGKSQTVFSILDLLPAGGSATVDSLWVDGKDVTALDRRSRHRLLGRTVGYVPQEPMSNLDPAYPIGRQLVEPLRSVAGMSRRAARDTAVATLRRVGISDAERVMKAYPHEISGGMAQRVLIAGAVACRPSIIVADEPTTALDVTVQAEVLELLRELQREDGMALVIVTHNFGVVADICDRVVVMRGGEVVETGTVAELFRQPRSGYTRELIAACLDDTDPRVALDAAAHRPLLAETW